MAGDVSQKKYLQGFVKTLQVFFLAQTIASIVERPHSPVLRDRLRS